MRIALPLVAALLPIILLPAQSFYFDVTPKVLVLLLGTGLALCTWEPRSIRGFGRPGIPLLILAQLGWLAVATALSTNAAISFYGGTWRRFGLIQYGAVLVYALLVHLDCLAKRERIWQYLRALSASGALAGLYAIAQYFGFDPWLPADVYHAGEAPYTIVRPPGTLGHADYLGFYLIVAFFSGWAMAAQDLQAIWRRAGQAFVAVTGLAILLSGTRAAMLGCAFGLLFLALRSNNQKRWLVAAPVAAICLLGFYFSPLGESLRTRVIWALDEPLGGARPLLWRDSAQMLLQKPLAGFGPETYLREFPRFHSIELAQRFPNFDHESPHNLFVDALVSQGLGGLLLLLATCSLGLQLAWKAAEPWRPLGAAFLGILVAGQFMSFTVATALSFYLLLALLAACTGGELFTPRRPLMWRTVALAVGTLLVVAGIPLAIADFRLHSTRTAIARGDLREALHSYELVRRWHPAGSSDDLYLSRELAELFRRTPDVRVKLAAWTPAFQAAGRAAREAESRHTALYNLAIFFATQNDSANVERSLRGAIAWAPNWYKPHWTLARLLQTQERMPEALREAEIAADRNGQKDSEVAATLEAIRRGQPAKP